MGRKTKYKSRENREKKLVMEATAATIIENRSHIALMDFARNKEERRLLRWGRKVEGGSIQDLTPLYKLRLKKYYSLKDEFRLMKEGQ